ncbi:actin [Microtus ochrogaster]|uniref:Actin n=1 Tax=Microtus ochrogaster TaxID=79684 RepID=A0A8J6KYP3_MICOH|nr:actin [Microtus ochrogaster]
MYTVEHRYYRKVKNEIQLPPAAWQGLQKGACPGHLSMMDHTPLVCDYGSGVSKVGFAGAEGPLAVFPTILGKLKHNAFQTKCTEYAITPSLQQFFSAGHSSHTCSNLLVGVEEKDWFIGAEAQNNLKNLNMHYPITRGAITDWDDVEKIWHHSFYQVLRVAPEEHPLMITEPPLNSTDVKCRMTQILFETFNVPALYVANQGVLSMYAAGRTSGITIECGEGMTYFVPVINGFPLQLSTTKLDIAGQDLTTYLLKLLSDSGNLLVSTGITIECGEGMTYFVPVINGFPSQLSTTKLDIAGQDLTTYLLKLLSDSGNLLVSTADREYIRDLKEKHCYVTLDYDMEMSKNAVPSQQKKVQLPDGREISLEQEALTCSEALFNTSLIGRSNPGIHMQVQQSITSCDHSHWRTLFGHIILSGGTGAFSGLRLRLQREISKLVSPVLCVKVATSSYAKYGAWVGASILSSLPMFREMWVTSHEYREIGSSVMCRRNL